MNVTSVVLRPVGVVKTVASDDDVRERYSDFESTIEIFPEYAEALEGIDGLL